MDGKKRTCDSIPGAYMLTHRFLSLQHSCLLKLVIYSTWYPYDAHNSGRYCCSVETQERRRTSFDHNHRAVQASYEKCHDRCVLVSAWDSRIIAQNRISHFHILKNSRRVRHIHTSIPSSFLLAEASYLVSRLPFSCEHIISAY